MYGPKMITHGEGPVEAGWGMSNISSIHYQYDCYVYYPFIAIISNSIISITIVCYCLLSCVLLLLLLASCVMIVVSVIIIIIITSNEFHYY